MSDSRLFNARVRWVSMSLMLVLGALVCLSVWQYCWAEISSPTAEERQVTRMVVAAMQKQPLAKHALDDEISRRGFKLFLDALDPLKSYFYQSDMDAFKQYETQLDDMLQRSDTTFARMVFERFLQRVNERVAMVDQLLTQEFDFTNDEEMVTDPDLLQYPRDEAEALERWRQRIKYDLLVLKRDRLAESKKDELAKDPAEEDKSARDKLSKRYHNFARRMKQLDNYELLEMFLTSITTSYDPHTSYMSPSSYDNFNIQLKLNLDGIGAQLADEDGRTVVAKIVPGGAAFKHDQLKKDDEIISVGQGESGEMVSTVGMKLNDVVKMVRGKAGTVVRLGVIPVGADEPVTYTITRAKIDLTDEAAHGEVFEVGTKSDGSPLKLGVLDLPSFYLDMQAAQEAHGSDTGFRSATTDVRKILEDFKTQQVDAVVLDLRRNGGGSLIEAIRLTGLFIDEGPILQVKDIRNRVEVQVDDDPGVAWGGPLVVVTSKFSASASEILAGAVQDYRRGLVVGDESTHGKGTVQSLQDLGELLGLNLGALKITVQQFFRPSGDSTQKRGVLSDIILPSITNYMDVGESDLDYAIEFHRVPKTDFPAVRLVSNDLVKSLQKESEQRISQSEDFAKLLKRVELFRQRKERKAITLNEQKFFEEGKESEAEKEERERLEEQLTTDNKIRRDFYLDEVLLITRDYIEALKQSKFANVN